MDKLNDLQKRMLIARMNELHGVSFQHHAQWATQEFGVEITGHECYSLFVEAENLQHVLA